MDGSNYLSFKELEKISVVGIQIVDRYNKVICHSKGCELIEGYKKEDVIGKDMYTLYNQGKKFKTLTSQSAIADTFRTRKPQKNILVSYTIKESDKIINVLCDTYLLFDKHKDIKSVVCIYRDVSDYLNLISLVNRLNMELNNQTCHLKNDTQYTFDHLIGCSTVFKTTVEEAKRMANTEESVLLIGETGTGKELFAQSIHNASSRCERRFIAINCSTIPESLLESTMFGTCKGAFTGAVDHKGLLEEAEGSTLFLDEINSMDIGLQAKLLRVLETKKFRRVGSNQEQSCDVRVISAMNQKPQKAIEDKKLRLDLYYRIAVFIIHIPPLREREGDILYLSDYFIKTLAPISGKKITQLSNEIAKVFEKYPWRGNIRELKHVILQSINVAKENEKIILPIHMQNHFFESMTSHSKNIEFEVSKTKEKDLVKNIGNYEKKLIEEALDENNYNITKTAKILNITRQSLHGKIKKYNLSTKKIKE